MPLLRPSVLVCAWMAHYKVKISHAPPSSSSSLVFLELGSILLDFYSSTPTYTVDAKILANLQLLLRPTIHREISWDSLSLRS